MELLGIRPQAKFDVLAVREVGGECKTLTTLKSLQPHQPELFEEVRNAIYVALPTHGPSAQEWKTLRGEIREFIFGGLPDPAFRIVWFQGREESEIIFSSAHLKMEGQGTPLGAIPIAERHREKYWYGLKPGRQHRIAWLEVSQI